MRNHKIAGVKPEETEVKPPAKEDTFEEAYKKQNPEKYAAKKKSGTFKVPALLAVIAFLGALALSSVVSAFYSNDAPKVVVEGNYIEAPAAVAPIPSETFGGASPVNPFNWYSNGGINYMTARGNMQVATSVLCVFLNPFTTGTSTMETFDWQITTGTSTAATIFLATSTSPYQTTTDTLLDMWGKSVAANAQATYSWNNGTSTPNRPSRTPLIGPNEYVLASIIEDITGAGAGGWTYTGACQAVFRKMPGSL